MRVHADNGQVARILDFQHLIIIIAVNITAGNDLLAESVVGVFVLAAMTATFLCTHINK